MLQAVESSVRLFDFIQMRLQRGTHVKALGPPGQRRQLIEAGFHLIGNADCQHGASRITCHTKYTAPFLYIAVQMHPF